MLAFFGCLKKGMEEGLHEERKERLYEGSEGRRKDGGEERVNLYK
jgi:hypothetical protein